MGQAKHSHHHREPEKQTIRSNRSYEVLLVGLHALHSMYIFSSELHISGVAPINFVSTSFFIYEHISLVHLIKHVAHSQLMQLGWMEVFFGLFLNDQITSQFRVHPKDLLTCNHCAICNATQLLL